MRGSRKIGHGGRILVGAKPGAAVPPVAEGGPATEGPAGRSHDDNQWSVLLNVSFHGSLLALVVEVTAGDQVEVLASSEVAADSQSASPRLPTTYLHNVDAVVERGEAGEELVDGFELGGLRRASASLVTIF